MTALRATALALLFALASLAPARAVAEALTPLRATALAPLPALGPILSVDRTLVAIPGSGRALRLAPGARAWTPARWADGAGPAGVVGAFGDARQAFAVLDTDGVASVERIDVAGAVLVRHPLPPLPEPLRDLRGAVRDGVVHVAGTGADGRPRLLRLDPVAGAAWAAATAWPAPGALVSLAAPSSGLVVALAEGRGQRLWQWTRDGDWRDRGPVPGEIVANSGRALGQAHVAYLVESGASASVMTFHSITGSWATLPGAAPAPGPPAAVAPWPDGMLWATPAAGGGWTPVAAQVQARKLLLRWLDWLVIVVYLAAMIGIGLYFYLREKRNSTENFFVGNRSIPFWAAGLSLYAVNTSSISFIAIPAKAFETNWQYLTNNLIAVVGLFFVAIWVVPLLRRLDLMSTFSYLETRFHPGIRMLASALAIVMQIGSRMSVILFLPALAIATITGISVVWSILLMGGFTIVYTAMGGMKAVIWTDVVQVIVKMGGALFAIAFIAWSLTGDWSGFAEFARMAATEDKTRLFDFSFDLTKATVWGFVFLVLFEVVLTFPKDQVLMQRVLSTPNEREASRSIWAFAAIMIPGGFVFYGIGTALYVYYKTNPERMNPLLPIDATFPLFIAAELPTGVTGLIVAGIFAAAMATLSGIMNSVATLITVDFYDRFAKKARTQKQGVFFAEAMTVVVGLVGIGAALVLSRFDVHSLFDVSIELAGLLGGGFAGAYTLGMFTRRANAPGVAIGIAAAIVLTFVAWSFDLVHPYFYLAISIMVCVVVGYLASLAFPPPARSLEGLTIHGRRRGAKAAAGG